LAKSPQPLQNKPLNWEQRLVALGLVQPLARLLALSVQLLAVLQAQRSPP
jgi:hypothetical protein